MDKPATPLPCPFCGSTDLLIQPWHGGGPDKHLIGCRDLDCEAAPAVTGETLAEAVAAWNRRVPYPTAINAELVEALEEARCLIELGIEAPDTIERIDAVLTRPQGGHR